MKFTKLFLPGRFEDAYIYMGRLLALTEDKMLSVYSFEQIIASLETKYSDFSTILTSMYLRNDWLQEPLFGSMMKNKEIARAFLAEINRFPRPFLELNGDEIGSQRESLDIPSHVFLDMLIYNRRLYLSADTGFYYSDIDWSQNTATFIDKPRKTLDARCLNTSAGYGTVNVSCGNDGLFTSFSEFELIQMQVQPELEKLAEKSLRTAWFDKDLVNYSSYTQPFLLEGYRTRLSAERVDHPASESIKQIDLGYLFERINREYHVDENSIQYIYNSNKVLFIHTFEGNFFSLGMQRSASGELKVRFTRTFKGTDLRILSVNSTKLGLVIETDNRILLFANNKWHAIFESEVLSVRAFPRSKHFQNIVVLTTEEGIWIISMFDDSALQG